MDIKIVSAWIEICEVFWCTVLNVLEIPGNWRVKVYCENEYL